MKQYQTESINKIFDDFLNLQSEDKKEKVLWLISQLSPYIHHLKQLRQEAWIKEGDYRNGFETYKYESVDEIFSNLEYISDRYNCAFRLNWLIGLLDPNDEQHKEQWQNNNYLF